MWLGRTFAAIQLLIAVAVESELAPAAAASQYNFVAKNVYTQSAGPNATAEPYMLTAISLTVSPGHAASHLAQNPLKISSSLNQLIAAANHNQKQSGRVPQDLDLAYHRTKEELQRAVDLENQQHIGGDCAWEIDGQVYEGELVRVFINKTDVQLPVKVRISGSWQSAGSIQMHRVRRELSELIESDRSKFFSAVSQLYTTDHKQGRKKFGPKYKPMDQIWYIHNLLGTLNSPNKTRLFLSHTANSSSLAPSFVENAMMTRSFNETVKGTTDMLEVQADTNDYSKLEMMVAPVAAERDQCSAEGAAAGSCEIGNQISTFSATADSVEQLLDGQKDKGTMAEVFTGILDETLQAVDPSVVTPFFKPRAGTNQQSFRRSRWVERVDLNQKRITGGDKEATVVASEFAFMPIIHGKNVVTADDGSSQVVHRAYSIPIGVVFGGDATGSS